MGCLRTRLACLGLIVAASAGCSEETGLVGVRQLLEVPPTLDFGAVQVGLTVEAELIIVNNGGANVRVQEVRPQSSLSTNDFLMGLPTEGFVVGPNAAVQLPVTYQPFEAGPHRVERRLGDRHRR